MKVEYTFAARQDLHNIYEYIAYTLLAPKAASDTANRIMSTISTLQSMQERNPLYKDEPWHSKGVHFVPVKRYIVFYTINTETETVTVSRIMFSGRDISNRLDETVDFLIN